MADNIPTRKRTTAQSNDYVTVSDVHALLKSCHLFSGTETY